MARAGAVRSPKTPSAREAPWADDLWFAASGDSGWWQMNAFVNYLLLRILKLDSSSASAARVTETQHRALLFVKGSPARDADGWVPLPVLRRSLLADNATAAQLVSRIRAKGLLETRRPVRNGPAYVRLTPKGETVLADVASRNRAALVELTENVGAENLPRILGHIIDYLGFDPPASIPKVMRPARRRRP